MKMPDIRGYFGGESAGDSMRMLRWIIGVVVLGAIVALLIIFWPTIMEAGQRYVGRRRNQEPDELDDIPAAA
jgi:hypothetical protein